jgi:hypothetical protein
MFNCCDIQDLRQLLKSGRIECRKATEDYKGPCPDHVIPDNIQGFQCLGTSQVLNGEDALFPIGMSIPFCAGCTEYLIAWLRGYLS